MKHTHAVRKTDRLHSFCDMFFSLNQLSLIGMAAGLLFNAYGIERPPALAPVFQGSSTSPLGLPCCPSAS